MIVHDSFNLICIIWIAIAVILLPLLLKVVQPYGRHSAGSWGPLINNRLGWFVMELPALVVFGWFILFRADFHNLLVLVPAMLWIAHYFHRVVIYPLQIRTRGKKIPLIITIFAFLFNIVNGYLNGYWFAMFVAGSIIDTLTIVRLTAGTILFISGFIINKYHDYILINLRSPDKEGYSIPYGGLFKYVSCPNFLGEIISWTGFALAAFSLPAVSFLVWTCVNLITRALDHHKWYKMKFPDYPAERKAVLPFLL